MFKNLFKSSKEIQYFIDCEYQFDESEELHNRLSRKRIDRQTAEQLEAAMKIVFKNGIVLEKYDIEEGSYSEKEVIESGNPLKYRDYPISNFKALILDSNGKHQLGGKAPEQFVYPENNTVTPYVYLGWLTNQDPNISWVPFERLHLIAPIYSNMGIIYLDYSNPLQPSLLNPKKDKIIDSEYNGIKPTDHIEFKAYGASLDNYTLNLMYNGQILGITGAPSFIQNDVIPKCPISGNEMKFLIQLESNNAIEMLSTNTSLEDNEMNRYFEKLNFWGDGMLYIFMEPSTKVVAYFIQNT